MAGERDVLAELEHEIREALPDARCGPEWRSRHAPECRQEDYEEVLLRVRAVLAALSPEPLPREAPDVERLASEVSALVSPEMVARRAEPYAQGYINAINYVLGIIALSPDRPTPP